MLTELKCESVDIETFFLFYGRMVLLIYGHIRLGELSLFQKDDFHLKIKPAAERI